MIAPIIAHLPQPFARAGFLFLKTRYRTSPISGKNKEIVVKTQYLMFPESSSSTVVGVCGAPHLGHVVHWSGMLAPQNLQVSDILFEI